MVRNLEHNSALPKSGDSQESSDSSGRKYALLNLKKNNNRAKKRNAQRKYHKKIEEADHQKADTYLDEKLSSIILDQNDLEFFLRNEYSNNSQAIPIANRYFLEQKSLGFSVSAEILKRHLKEKLGNNADISIADKVIDFKEELEEQGKSKTQILQILISKFENNATVSVWVANWKNFLKLHQFAETKPPAEREVIMRFISTADFSNENAFVTSLSQISKSSKISEATKLEIAQKFNASNITTVGAMDNTLKNIQTRKKNMEKAIDTKKTEKESLKFEIEDIENQLEALPPLDPKREEIEAKLTKRKQRLKDTETTIQTLLEESPPNVSFPLREGYTAKLNPNGTRTIEIDDLNFSVKFPKNTLFMSRKNMLSINLAFVYRAFSLNGMERIFTPNLKNGVVPDKKNRLFGSRILKQLGYPTNLVLSQSNILQLQKDLSKLNQKGSSNTGMEDLTTLGIWDITNQEVNYNHLNTCLGFIRKHRGRDLGFEHVLQESQNIKFANE